MKILVTGAAGFIGYHISEKLLENNHTVLAIDNINDYYDINLKNDRLKNLKNYKNFIFKKIDISDKSSIDNLIKKNADITHIVHLAAQAGVRYSIENPMSYVYSNLVGHTVMLEVARNLKKLKHFIYASSSSVYGTNTKYPFSTKDRTDNPISLYAATKKSDELLTESYYNLYNIPTTGLRFFTVYGPWGRPDMAAFIFVNNILNKKPITVFNKGNMKRDFTYIDDVTDGIYSLITNKPKENLHRIYNLGNNKSEKIEHFIDIIENVTAKKAIKKYAPMQEGDVKETYADISESTKDFGYLPQTTIEEGLPKFINWFKEYYKI